MKLSIIQNKDIDGKVLKTNYVNLVQEFNDLSEFALLLINFNICTAVFKNVKYIDGWSKDPYVNAISLCQSNRWRYDVNCESIDFIAFDFDDGTLPETIQDKFKDFNYVMAASTNHMKDKGTKGGILPRFHIFIRLKSPINDSDFYKFLFETLVKKYDISSIDPSVKNIGRFYKQHLEILKINDGIDFDCAEFKFTYEKSLNSKLFKSIKSSVVISDTDIEDTIRFKKKIKPLLLDTTGSSHYGVFCACGYCKWYGIDESTAYSIISKYVTVDKLDEIISNIWSKL